MKTPDAIARDAMRNRQAFTLLEIAFILLIIGLSSSAILLGKDLLRAAETRRMVHHFQELNSAVVNFQSKYQCLPGDCAVASRRWAGAINGNGNRQIFRIAAPDFRDAVPEMINVWNHLSRAALISSSYADYQDNNNYLMALSGSTGDTLRNRGFSPAINVRLNINLGHSAAFENPIMRTGHYFIPMTTTFVDYSFLTTIDPTPPCHVANLIDDIGVSIPSDCPFLTPADAYAIDNKMDDGNPGAGFVFSIAPDALGRICEEAARPNLYNTANTLATCRMVIRATDF